MQFGSELIRIWAMNQVQVLQKLSGEQRLKQALILSDFVRELAIKNIKKELGKKATPKKIQKELHRRLWES